MKSTIHSKILAEKAAKTPNRLYHKMQVSSAQDIYCGWVGYFYPESANLEKTTKE